MVTIGEEEENVELLDLLVFPSGGREDGLAPAEDGSLTEAGDVPRVVVPTRSSIQPLGRPLPRTLILPVKDNLVIKEDEINVQI